MNRSMWRAPAAFLAVIAAIFLASCSSDESASEVELDKTPPTVLASFPDSGAVNVTRSGPFWIAFSEPMNEDSVEAAFSLSPEPVSFSMTWRGDTLIVTPTVILDPATGYTMTVAAAAEDEHGNELGVDVVIDFMTTAAQDNISPTVVSTIPANGASGVLGTQTIEIVWSEPMDQTVDMESAITMSPEPTDWWIEWESVTMKIVHSAFPEDDYVTVTIGTQMRDLAGNNLVLPFVLSFTTVNDDTRPTLVSAVPPNGQTGVTVGLEEIVLTFSEPMDQNSFEMEAEDIDARVNQVVREQPTWNVDFTVISVPVLRSLLPGCTYWVNFRDVTDASGNVIDPNPTPYEFTTAGTVTYYPVKNGYLWNVHNRFGDLGTRGIENFSPGNGNFDEVLRDQSSATQEVVHLQRSSNSLLINHLGRDEYEDGVYQSSMMWEDPIPYIKLPLADFLGDSWTFSTSAAISDSTTMALSGRIEIDAATVDLVSEALDGTFRGCYVHHLYADWTILENGNPVDEGGTHQILWLAPGVGPVQIVTQDNGGYVDTLRVYDWSL